MSAIWQYHHVLGNAKIHPQHFHFSGRNILLIVVIVSFQFNPFRHKQSRRTKTVNNTKHHTTSLRTDILAMCCAVISSFVISAVYFLQFASVILARHCKLSCSFFISIIYACSLSLWVYYIYHHNATCSLFIVRVRTRTYAVTKP